MKTFKIDLPDMIVDFLQEQYKYGRIKMPITDIIQDTWLTGAIVEKLLPIMASQTDITKDAEMYLFIERTKNAHKQILEEAKEAGLA